MAPPSPWSEIFVLANECQAVLSELTPQRLALEELFMELTHDSVQFGVREGAA